MTYQLGGYYVMRLNTYFFAPAPAYHLFTVCTDFNDNLLDYLEWERPEWLHREAERASTNIETFFLADLDGEQLQAWINQKYQEGKLEWLENFSDLAAAYEYRDLFFRHVPNVYILSLSFLEADVQSTLQELKTKGIVNPGALWKQFAKPITPNPQEKGKVIGYDIIGLELGCITLDSFLVHSTELFEPFGVRINQFGLINDERKQKELMAFMNNPASPVEPESWYWAQVKLFE